MKGNWPIGFSPGCGPLEFGPLMNCTQTLVPSPKPRLDPNSTKNWSSCIIICHLARNKMIIIVGFEVNIKLHKSYPFFNFKVDKQRPMLESNSGS